MALNCDKSQKSESNQLMIPLGVAAVKEEITQMQ